MLLGPRYDLVKANVHKKRLIGVTDVYTTFLFKKLGCVINTI